MNKLFLDTNVLIDFVADRKDYPASKRVIQLAETKHVRLAASVLTMVNMTFILRAQLAGKKLYQTLESLSSLMDIAPMTRSDYASALESKAHNFEDALQYYCAVSAGCDAILTRNVKDFTFSPIPVMTPMDFLLDYFKQTTSGE